MKGLNLFKFTKSPGGLLSIFACIALLLSAVLFISSRQNSYKTVSTSRYATYTVVIDPGHGGMDGGAVGTTYQTLEKDINLQISQKLYLFMRLMGVPAFMTRTEDISLNFNGANTVRKNKTADLAARYDFTRRTPSPVFLSVHMNKFEQSKYKGAQVFYSKNHDGSRLLGEYLQHILTSHVDPSNTRAAKQADSSIFLLKNLRCPAVIVECGFLSNPDEEALLKTDEYQKKLALAITMGYMNFLFTTDRQ